MPFTHYRTYGFVFKKEDKREADRIYAIFTLEYGRIQVLGRAIRKITSKLRSGIDLFYLSEIEFIQGKNYKTLTDTQLLNEFKGIRRSPIKLKIAFRVAEVLDRFLTFEEQDKKIWDLIINTFKKLDNIPSFKAWLLFYYFLWNFLSLLGYQPELYNCTLCQRKLTPVNLSFSKKEGGIICERCRKKEKKVEEISPETVKILRMILKGDWETLDRIKNNYVFKKELQKTSSKYYFYLLSSLRQSDKISQ